MILDDYQLRCGEFSDIRDHLPRLHLEASKPGVKIIELGVRAGNSTAAFLAAAQANDGHVWSVDICPPYVPSDWCAMPEWTFIVGDDLDIADRLPDAVDIVFIDTSHTYDQTLTELWTYRSKLKPGGVFICHDTELEHPDASPPSDPPFPVATAIREFCQETGAAVEWVAGCWGLGVIRLETQ